MSATVPPPDPSNPKVLISTSVGDITVELFAKDAPISTENFLRYVNENFYQGLIFHRVIKGFMIQGGGMDKDMRQKKTHSPIKLEINPKLRHWNGALAMARTAVKDSATGQFYICHGPQAGLDNNYAVFGVVRQGIAVVEQIAKTPTGPGDKPKTDITILGAKVI